MASGTHTDDEEDFGSSRLYGHYYGQVRNTADPEKRGRIRCFIPGITEVESGWIVPVGLPGAGFTERGAFSVPPIGAQVVVAFIQGDIDEPIYFAGPYAQNEAPARVKAVTAEDGSKLRIIETDGFEVLIDESTDNQRLTVTSKKSGDYIEINAKDGPSKTANTITVQSSASLLLRATGLVAIEGLQVQINGRLVTPGTEPI